MDAKHTEAPWQVVTGSEHEAEQEIADVHSGVNGFRIIAAKSFLLTDKVGEANARLIAAAPLLLAALRAVEWGGYRHACPTCDQWEGKGHAPDCQLFAAIRAAEGQP